MMGSSSAAPTFLLLVSLLLLIHTIVAFLPSHHLAFSPLKTFRIQGGAHRSSVDTSIRHTAARQDVSCTRLHAKNTTSSKQDESDEEWYPMDPAYTTPQLLSAQWFMIAGANNMVKGEIFYTAFSTNARQGFSFLLE